MGYHRTSISHGLDPQRVSINAENYHGAYNEEQSKEEESQKCHTGFEYDDEWIHISSY